MRSEFTIVAATHQQGRRHTTDKPDFSLTHRNEAAASKAGQSAHGVQSQHAIGDGTSQAAGGKGNGGQEEARSPT
jgi:hypothetical protein